MFQLDSIFLNIIVMTLGEIEFNDIFLDPKATLKPFGKDVRIILFIFLFLMPIVLMNLLVCYSQWEEAYRMIRLVAYYYSRELTRVPY